jgi:hypothetical protein
MSRTRSWIRIRIRTKMSRIPNTGTSVADPNPDPPDSRVFDFLGLLVSGSGPISQRYIHTKMSWINTKRSWIRNTAVIYSIVRCMTSSYSVRSHFQFICTITYSVELP